MRRPLPIATVFLIGSAATLFAQATETPADGATETPATAPKPPVCKMVQGPVMTRRCASGLAWFERCGKGANQTMRDTNTCVE